MVSILSQDLDDFEFFIFDDGSIDRSQGIVKRFASQDHRIKLFQGNHKGHAHWLNEGVRMASAEYIARMDADDISLPQRFRRQLDYLRRESNCVAVGCDLLQIDEDGDPVMTVKHDVEHAKIEADLLDGGLGVISHPASMLRRSTILAIGGYKEEYEYIEDFDLWLRLAEQGHLANLPEVLFKYRLHHTNVIYSGVERQRQLADRIIMEARTRRSLKPLPHSIWNFTAPTLVERHRTWAWQAAGSGYYRTALKHAVKSFQIAPLSLGSWWALFFSLTPRSLRQVLKHALSVTGLLKVAR